MNDLVAAFNEYFEVVSADSPALLQEVFRVRYHILCIEQRLPNFQVSTYPDGLERDEYDRHSLHVLLRHRPSGKFVGTARLILADPLNPGKPFPIERYAKLDPSLIDIGKLPRQHTAEISRFAILSRFSENKGQRRRYGIETSAEQRNSKHQRRFPHPLLALGVGVIAMCRKHSISHWLSVMDPALNRLLNLYSLHFEPIGPLVNYHGLRLPYYVNLTRMLDRAYAQHREVWELLTDYGKVWPAPLEHHIQGMSNPQQTSHA